MIEERGGFVVEIVKQVGKVFEIAMPIGEKWTVSRCRYQAKENAKGRLCVATGIHGDEMMGQLIVYEIAQRIMAQPQYLAGTVDLYPMLNPLGMDISERMVPAGTRLDMNRAFPGAENGTPMEAMCYHIMQDMMGADLVLDIHSSAPNKSEIYGVRMNARDAQKLLGEARALCPQVIWVYPQKRAYDAQLTSALSAAGTPAMILAANECSRYPLEDARKVVDGIFCKMKEMGIWTGEAIEIPAQEAPCVRTQQDMCRITCTKPGMYVSEYRLGEWVKRGESLGKIIDALSGEMVEEVLAPASGLVFSQRSYSAVYPGTLIARLCRKE